MKDTITFRNETQKTLWDMELVGQISDGQWENARPYDHWIRICRAETRVGDDVGLNFYAKKTNYNLAAKDLLDVVGKRMLHYVRLALTLGLEKAKVFEVCMDLDGNWRGVPNYDGEYYNNLRCKIAEIGAEERNVAKFAATDESLFSMKDLRRELRDMKKILKLRN